MVYVFGMEGVPLFEMIFIIMLLMLAGLIFLLFEIWKLKDLLSQGRMDIKRFEQNLGKFDSEKGKKPSSNLINYVTKARDSGMTDDRIHESLTKAGWKPEEAKSILNNAL